MCGTQTHDVRLIRGFLLLLMGFLLLGDLNQIGAKEDLQKASWLVKIAGWCGVAIGAVNLLQAVVIIVYTFDKRRDNPDEDCIANAMRNTGNIQVLDHIIDLTDVPLLTPPEGGTNLGTDTTSDPARGRSTTRRPATGRAQTTGP